MVTPKVGEVPRFAAFIFPLQGFSPGAGLPPPRLPASPGSPIPRRPGGDSTVADYAWPERKVLLYIDGLSETLHGNPRQRRLDHVRRARAESRGYQVIDTSAEALQDDTSLSILFRRLAEALEGGAA